MKCRVFHDNEADRPVNFDYVQQNPGIYQCIEYQSAYFISQGSKAFAEFTKEVCSTLWFSSMRGSFTAEIPDFVTKSNFRRLKNASFKILT